MWMVIIRDHWFKIVFKWNIIFTLFFTQNLNLHNIISILRQFDSKIFGFILFWVQNYQFDIVSRTEKLQQYNFEISQKGTILYQILLTLSPHSWPQMVSFSKNGYDNYWYRYTSYKNQYNNFWDRDCLCFQSCPTLGLIS